jgi:uncharacterized cupin superfamily protein
MSFQYNLVIFSFSHLIVTVAHPHTASAVHHHGEQGQPSPLSSCRAGSNPVTYFTTDTIVYAASRRGAVTSENGKTRQELSPGDLALIPACTGHQEVNGGDDEVTVREINPFSLTTSCTRFFSSAPKTSLF